MTNEEKLALYRLHSKCIEKILEIIDLLAQEGLLLSKVR